jgi:hypothetical protein
MHRSIRPFHRQPKCHSERTSGCHSDPELVEGEEPPYLSLLLNVLPPTHTSNAGVPGAPYLDSEMWAFAQSANRTHSEGPEVSPGSTPQQYPTTGATTLNAKDRHATLCALTETFSSSAFVFQNHSPPIPSRRWIEATDSIAFVFALNFLLPFSAQKSHVKSQNHLNPYQAITSTWQRAPLQQL